MFSYDDYIFMVKLNSTDVLFSGSKIIIAYIYDIMTDFKCICKRNDSRLIAHTFFFFVYKGILLGHLE